LKGEISPLNGPWPAPPKFKKRESIVALLLRQYIFLFPQLEASLGMPLIRLLQKMSFGTHTNLWTSGIILEYASFVKYRHLMARTYGLEKFLIKTTTHLGGMV